VPLIPGSDFGPYRIIAPLGRGGMASVHKAYEAGLDRYVALKVLPDSKSALATRDRAARDGRVPVGGGTIGRYFLESPMRRSR